MGKTLEMRLYLSKAIEENRIIQLQCSDKYPALQELCEKTESAYPKLKDINLFEKVKQREEQAPTFLGYGIACPHARAENESQIICAIGWTPSGIQYGQKPDQIAYIIFLYIIPETSRNEYLNEMAAIAKMIHNDKNKDTLKLINSLDQLREILLSWEAQIPQKTETTPSQQNNSIQTKGIYKVLAPDISEMLQEGRLNQVKEFINNQDAADIAEILSELPAHQSILLFKLIPRTLASDVFSLLEYELQNQLIMNMANEETKHLISSLPPDDRTALFEELPANVTQRILDLLNDKDRKEALKLLSYPKDSVGRLMTNKYVTVKPEWTTEQAIEHIRKNGQDSETITMVYIVNEKGVLVDDLRLRKIILATPSTKISELLDGRFAALQSTQDREDAVKAFKKYDLFALPVIDQEGILLGIITSDDILDVSEEEATEDFHKTMAIKPIEGEYLSVPILLIYKNRIPWLVTLVFVNVLSGAGLAYFEELIASCVALVFFLPLLIGSAGNAGSQAATLVIRSMALGEMNMSDFLKTLFRELRISILLGLSMSLAVFILAWLRSGHHIAIIVSISMIVVVCMGSIMGMLLPFIFKKVKIDPAVASGPLVASLSDILGVIIYMTIASNLLRYFKQ